MKYIFLCLAVIVGITSGTPTIPIRFPQKAEVYKITPPLSDTSTDHQLRMAIQKNDLLVSRVIKEDINKDKVKEMNYLLKRKVDSLSALCQVKKLDPNNIVIIK